MEIRWEKQNEKTTLAFSGQLCIGVVQHRPDEAVASDKLYLWKISAVTEVNGLPLWGETMTSAGGKRALERCFKLWCAFAGLS